MAMNLLRVSASRSVRIGRSSAVHSVGQISARRMALPRAYTTGAAQQSSASSNSSNTPWFIGSLMVFGPILFKLTSPPPTKKTQEKAHVEPIAMETAEPAAPATAPAPKIQKPYVLIGAGTASFAAAQAIKEKQPDANVIIIGNEEYAPYMRPPLSKELWFSEDPEVAKTLLFKDWQGTERNTIYQDESQYEVIEDASGSDLQTSKIKLLLNKQVAKLNIEDHTVTLADGSIIYYNKVLLATGGEPKNLPDQAGKSDKVTTFRTVEDFKKLDQIAKDGAHIAVVGGGFLGSELAVALAKRAEKEKLTVTQVFPEEGNMANVFPSYLTKWTTSRVRKLGVNVQTDSAIKAIKTDENSKVVLDLGNDKQVTADHVVVAVGIQPRVDLAREAGLEVDEKRAGVVVNAELEARTDVFAAGDMVSFHDVQLGRRRIEHHDHAVLSGRHAGENMVGGAKPYKHQSMSDLGPEIGYEAVGLVDAQLSTVSVWAKATAQDTPAAGAGAEAESPRGTPIATPSAEATKTASAGNPFKDEKFGKGLVFYVREKQIVGLLLFNVFGKVQEARDIIDAGYTTEQIDGLLKKFNLHDDSH
ncbi:apoptosis-inducing factor, mitochondrion-associated, C-term-domain-containing protein [Zychaea mexicana]|uniref:apoptosis-inducing factor, mitochondrion-associated, C-term-domain-containing protein n=1 Tax=Zychaea mexicana TaxID=64656 RepID=UPI0022FEDE71|nr:apoptosis-inducing factor, mitochondrion-associated, C-term-domain-containing protein [Zychaea mexicana]KAI9498205.1 apoptosis-inducing factor, mitochondrion-associated, C-term-domain-containing protein [Zychaea mexicana]